MHMFSTKRENLVEKQFANGGKAWRCGGVPGGGGRKIHQQENRLRRLRKNRQEPAHRHEKKKTPAPVQSRVKPGVFIAVFTGTQRFCRIQSRSGGACSESGSSRLPPRYVLGAGFLAARNTLPGGFFGSNDSGWPRRWVFWAKAEYNRR